MTRPLEELLSGEDAWPDIAAWAEASRHDVEVVEAAKEDGERALLALQVTTRSVLGACAYHGESGTVLYLQPDGLTWLDFERGHEAWLRWLLEADLEEFYGDVRWPGWEDDAARPADDRTHFFTPPLFLKPDDGRRERGEVPVAEAWSLAHDFREQLGLDD